MSKKNPTIQTTKLGNKVQKGKGKKPEKKTEAEEHVLNAGEEPVGHKETIRFFFGLVLLILALFMHDRLSDKQSFPLWIYKALTRIP